MKRESRMSELTSGMDFRKEEVAWMCNKWHRGIYSLFLPSLSPCWSHPSFQERYQRDQPESLENRLSLFCILFSWNLGLSEGESLNWMGLCWKKRRRCSRFEMTLWASLCSLEVLLRKLIEEAKKEWAGSKESSWRLLHPSYILSKLSLRLPIDDGFLTWEDSMLKSSGWGCEIFDLKRLGSDIGKQEGVRVCSPLSYPFPIVPSSDLRTSSRSSRASQSSRSTPGANKFRKATRTRFIQSNSTREAQGKQKMKSLFPNKRTRGTLLRIQVLFIYSS